jgi:catechol 2,3-dioxygenase-like lactoylglutathione lyase family enzyme
MGRFYAEALGLELLENTDDFSALTDGTVNIVLCRGDMFRPTAVSRPGFAGLHHIGFEVDSRAPIEARLRAMDATYVGGDHDSDGPSEDPDADPSDSQDSQDSQDKQYEVKWLSPDGLIFDLSEGGWPTSRPTSRTTSGPSDAV